MVNYVTCANFANVHILLLSPKLLSLGISMRLSKDVKGREVMAKEIEALELSKSWTIEDLPPHKKLIHCKGVYNAKYNSYGTV